MQYHLDTIPVWEAMEQEDCCPLCALYQKCELSEIDRSLGGSVMEPSVRIQVNERGMCQTHHKQLFMMQNRLGHALMVDSHSKELIKKLDKLDKLLPANEKRGLFSAKGGDLDPLINALDGLSNTCVICENIDQHMLRYTYTFLHLWKNDKAFLKKWDGSNGVCMPHAAMLLTHAKKHLNEKQQSAFAASLLSLLKENLVQDEKDLEWFTLKFDYRNQDKPWGNSKNALERTINRLRGRCVGDEKK